ncbi:MAG: 4-alpha-glucanotransferase [Byssovorax sp.]
MSAEDLAMQTPTNDKRRRVAGVTVPLFSLRSSRSWGIGEIGDLPDFAGFVRASGFRLVQILPLNEISGGETSPYSALTAFGIDPMYISLADVADLGMVRDTGALPAGALEAIGGDAGALLLSRARQSDRIDYEAVRVLKRQALRYAFERFLQHDLKRSTPRAAAFLGFRARHQEWLADYALFRALKDAHGGVAWWDFDAKLRDRVPAALAEARDVHEKQIVFYEYLQWLAHSQWFDARARLASMGVEVMGDFPFMVGRDSSDVWAHQSEFRDDASAGVPPDAFNADGQEWGLPPYYWDRMRQNDFAWLRRRARYTGSLYDRFRIDHLVGFFRSYMRPRGKLFNAAGKLVPGVFDPVKEADQQKHGERVVSAMMEAAAEAGARLVAEDLGVVPDFVRTTLTKLEVPGYKVLIWEKDGEVFRSPASYPLVSLACFGTHDTDPVAVWWEGLDDDERAAVKALRELAPAARELGKTFTPEVHRALVDLLNGAGSELVLFLVQDVLGSRDRINTPATTGPQNWTYRLPGTVDDLSKDAALAPVLSMFQRSLEKHGRA